MAEIQQAQGRYGDAEQAARQALASATELADSHRRAAASTTLAEILAASGQSTAADQMSTEASALLDTLSGPAVEPLRHRIVAVRASLP
jgi:ATP/maltotriose-dependent transcriptional regulator MalT